MHRRPYSGVFWLAKLLLTLGLENFNRIPGAYPKKTEMRGRGQLVKLCVLETARQVAAIWTSINANLVRALVAQRDQ